MALKNVLLMLTAVSLLLANVSTSARELISLDDNKLKRGLGVDYIACLTGGLRVASKCSNVAFINGQVKIDEPCCNALGAISQGCWPLFLDILGLTPEKFNLLKGVCDKSSSRPAAAPSASVTRA